MNKYKRFTILGEVLHLDWSLYGKEWAETKDFVKITMGAKFEYKNKIWILPYTSYNVSKLKMNGFVDAAENYVCRYTIKEFPDHKDFALDEEKLPETIRDYQQEAIQFIKSRNESCLIGLPVGSGKSLIYSCFTEQTNYHKPWLIIVPATIKITIHKEIQKWTKLNGFVAYSTFTSKMIKKHHDYIVINYDIMHKVVEELKGNIIGIICDEAHYLANETSKRTMAVMALAKTVEKKIFVSGTLLKNRPFELYPLLNMVDPIYWKDRSDYIRRYCGTRVGYAGHLVHDGATNLDELHKRVTPYLFYKSFEEILPNLPPIQDMFYQVEISDKTFIELNNEIEQMLEDENVAKADLLMKMAELTRSAFFHKRTAIYEAVDNYIAESGEKIVLVALHKVVIQDIVDKYKCDYIAGDIPAHRRNAIIERFHESDSKVLVLQIEAANAGFSILCSRAMVMCEVNYSYTSYSQIKARIRRMNTVADKCLYYHFVGEGSVEERMLQLMSAKENTASVVITGNKSTSLKDAYSKYEKILSDD